ncbi:MAG TPA: alcohol dehydrogenase catalytic domain-containing protein [Candidatus Deferrimicrobiaceae bacterium]|nr:alcohol dehydrogenase catalytic domain-containing protein [Candidatus Deferrimicrobiaceae bacterium]
MKAAVCEAFAKPLVVKEVPEPSVGPGEVLIRMKGCGVCHSDLHLVDGDWADWGTPLPIIPGHEVTGVVEKAGDGVTGLKQGDKVGVPWMQYACGQCPACRSGAEMLCASQKTTGVTVDGGYAEWVKAPAAFTHRIPEGLDLVTAAPLLCAGITVFSPLRRAGNLAGKTVAVAGIGGLGHLGIRMAAAMGAHVVAITRGGDKKDLAHELGAHAVIDSEKEKAGKQLARKGGADLILLTGISARLFEECIPGLAPNGTLVVLAAIAEAAKVIPAALLTGQKRIEGSVIGTRDDMDAMLTFAADHGIVPIVERHPLGTVNDVLERMRRGKIRLRAVLTP